MNYKWFIFYVNIAVTLLKASVITTTHDIRLTVHADNRKGKHFTFML